MLKNHHGSGTKTKTTKITMHDLMNLEMSRTEFLKLLGVSVGSILGFGYLIGIMSKMKNTSQPTVARGNGKDAEYGTRKFGL